MLHGVLTMTTIGKSLLYFLLQLRDPEPWEVVMLENVKKYPQNFEVKQLSSSHRYIGEKHAPVNLPGVYLEAALFRRTPQIRHAGAAEVRYTLGELIAGLFGRGRMPLLEADNIILEHARTKAKKEFLEKAMQRYG